MRAISMLLLGIAGCSSGGGSSDNDLAVPRDGAGVRDQSIPDLLGSGDASVRDAVAPDDLVPPADLARNIDSGAGGQGMNSAVNCGAVCKAPKSVCCRPSPFGNGACIAPGDPCGAALWFCDDSSDCGRQGDVCCIVGNGSNCMPRADCDNGMGRIACQMKADCPMLNGQQMDCCGVGASPEYYCGVICPISRRKHKADIHYLQRAEVARLHDEITRYPITTWRYKDDPTRAPHLGFIIDDVAPSPAVAPGGERVDLYGYTTMAVAAIQEQARRIAELEAEMKTLRELLERRDRADGHAAGATRHPKHTRVRGVGAAAE